MKKGFTLVEILVVIVIIGVLASLVTYAGTNSFKSARDTQRKNDLREIKKAMVAAKNECRGKAWYPWAQDNGSTNNDGYTHYASLNLYLYKKGLLKKQLWDPTEAQENFTFADPAKVDTTNEGPAIGHYRYKFYDGHALMGARILSNNVCTGTDNSNFTYGGQPENVWLLRVQLDKKDDPEAAASFERCKDARANQTISDLPVPSNTDGNYYVCD